MVSLGKQQGIFRILGVNEDTRGVTRQTKGNIQDIRGKLRILGV